ncbi:hypothetical protein [Telluribacter humicola]|uniref:hypothetical protein n=1 Tax=Telluribacter humicola TaxID=1720261 RepID=UPI001A970F34|nr:hypothetical protein [Telluribacter humicola]
MQKLALLLLMGISTIACQDGTIDKQGDQVIRYKETVNLNDSPKATLTFSEVQDSRCPEGVQCVWAGNATVDLTLTSSISSSTEPELVQMCLGDCRTLYPNKPYRTADTLNYTLAGQSYRFILKAVNPSPKADKEVKKEDYTITLGIEKM